MKRIALMLVVGMMPLGCAEAFADQWLPSDEAKSNFKGGNGLSWRVDFDEGGPVLKRARHHLPLEAYKGSTETVFKIEFAEGRASKPKVKKHSWDNVRAEYQLSSGTATLTVNRLCPAVLIESPARSVTFNCSSGPQHIAFVHDGNVVVRNPGEATGDLSLSEPWVLAWFGEASPARAHVRPHDVEGVIGVSKGSIGFSREADVVDLPVLFRLEHKPRSIRHAEGSGLKFDFAGEVGKIAMMPLAGGKLFLPEETAKWAEQLPPQIIEQCRQWSARLRDYPLSVAEAFKVRSSGETLTIENDFQWMSFSDDWNSPAIKAAPIPPMLALALDGGMPVKFTHDNREVKPVDYGLMDTAGKAMAIEGFDSYEYEISGLDDLLAVPTCTHKITDSNAKVLQQKLEKHVARMVDGPPLTPLLYIYGGIGGTWFSHFYWAAVSETAQALEMAYPYLSEPLQKKAIEYLRNEWQANPPFTFNRNRYTAGRLRTPYEFPWAEIRQLTFALNRESAYRQSDHLFNLHGIDAYLRITGEQAGDDMREKFRALTATMLGKQDWAIMGPARFKTIGDRHAVFYYNLQGCATYNRWLAGAVAMTRIARRHGWEIEEKIGLYLASKLAIARIGQARYISEMHRHGLVRGDPKDDNRTLLHIDTTCAVIGRGPMEVGVHQNQELPPFNDLTEEVGRLLGKYARDECKTYLDHLDYSLPLWYISEAPKQQATEHRTSPLQNYNGNVLAQYWILGKDGGDFARYIDTTRFIGDLYYIRNLAAAIDSYAEEPTR